MNFGNKVAIITGSGSGIGKATAILFAKEGAKVVVVDKYEEKVNKSLQEITQNEQKHLGITADLYQEKDIKMVIQKTIEKYGKIDILVNNAGIMRFGSILDGSLLETYEELLNVNLRPVVYLTTLAAPHLAKTKGNIVNIGSTAALEKPQAFDITIYCITKAAVNHFTRCSALELAASGVRVNCVNPGCTSTEIFVGAGWTRAKSDEVFQGIDAPLKKVADPSEVGDLILYLASDKAKSITGSCNLIDNGYMLINH